MVEKNQNFDILGQIGYSSPWFRGFTARLSAPVLNSINQEMKDRYLDESTDEDLILKFRLLGGTPSFYSKPMPFAKLNYADADGKPELVGPIQTLVYYCEFFFESRVSIRLGVAAEKVFKL
jgi:hypothetical protein